MKVLQDMNGVLYKVRDCELVAVAEMEILYEQLKGDVALLEPFVAKIRNQDAGQANATPADTTPPADQGQAAPADQGQPATPTADPNQPDAPANPAPATDPSAQPAPAAPATDPNQAQPQTEQPAMPQLA